MKYVVCTQYIDGLVQERRNSSALAMELRLSSTNLSTYAIAVQYLGQNHAYAGSVLSNLNQNQPGASTAMLDVGVKWVPS